MRTLLILALCLQLLLPMGVLAAPTVTAGTAYGASPGIDPDTGTYTNGAGSNRVMLLMIACRDSADTVADPSAVTYAGAAMSLLVSTGAFNGTTLQGWIYYKVNPASGSNSWSVDWPDNCNQSLIVPMTVIDADQSSNPFSSSNSATGSGSTSVTCSTASGELILDLAFFNDGGHTMAVGANQTQLSNDSVGGGNILGGTSWQAGADGGAMTWTLSAGTDVYGAVCGSIRGAATDQPRMIRGFGVPGLNSTGIGGPLP